MSSRSEKDGLEEKKSIPARNPESLLSFLHYKDLGFNSNSQFFNKKKHFLKIISKCDNFANINLSVNLLYHKLLAELAQFSLCVSSHTRE